MRLHRRDFLKLSSLGLGAALLPPLPPVEAPRQAHELGRVIKSVYVYNRPSFQARSLRLWTAETIFDIYDTVESEDQSYNRTWYQVQSGYVHSATIQPVRWQVQTPELEIPKAGLLAEVTVPFTAARAAPRSDAASAYRFYYSTTHWVTQVKKDTTGLAWYEVHDDRLRKSYWVRADHLRRILPAEVSPLSPGARKRIEVDLERQVFRCLEDDQVVLEALCSTGPYLRTENGRRIFGTPSGEWMINRKRPSRHMAGDDFASADFFDLPGVPWVSYFHWWGVSIHGTYWHNDYGRPRSHGCVNLPPETAKWVYRWTRPHDSLQAHQAEGEGTQVVVI